MICSIGLCFSLNKSNRKHCRFPLSSLKSLNKVKLSVLKFTNSGSSGGAGVDGGGAVMVAVVVVVAAVVISSLLLMPFIHYLLYSLPSGNIALKNKQAILLMLSVPTYMPPEKDTPAIIVTCPGLTSYKFSVVAVRNVSYPEHISCYYHVVTSRHFASGQQKASSYEDTIVSPDSRRVLLFVSGPFAAPYSVTPWLLGP